MASGKIIKFLKIFWNDESIENCKKQWLISKKFLLICTIFIGIMVYFILPEFNICIFLLMVFSLVIFLDTIYSYKKNIPNPRIKNSLSKKNKRDIKLLFILLAFVSFYIIWVGVLSHYYDFFKGIICCEYIKGSYENIKSCGVLQIK